MILNSLIKKNDFSFTFKEQIDSFNRIGYGDLNNDALWKWSAILYSLNVLGVNEDNTVVDIGGGRSPLTKIISNTCEIINVDKYPGGNWFPLGANGDYFKSQGIAYNPNNIRYADRDFLEWAKEQPDNSFDFMYDSCSVIHFDVKSTHSLNDGCAETIAQVERLLKPGGYFIATSDLLHPMYLDKISMQDNKGEFLYIENMLNMYNFGSLKTYGDTDLTLESDFYTNILNISTSLHNYNKLNHSFYGIEDWQTFSNYEGTCGFNLVRGRMVLRKVTNE